MNWIQKLFAKKDLPKNGKVIWSGTISSNGPEQQGPITVLSLRTDFDKSEFEEGCTNGAIDYHAGKEMEKNLNYPCSPYARGYIETYRGLTSINGKK